MQKPRIPPIPIASGTGKLGRSQREAGLLWAASILKWAGFCMRSFMMFNSNFCQEQLVSLKDTDWKLKDCYWGNTQKPGLANGLRAAMWAGREGEIMVILAYSRYPILMYSHEISVGERGYLSLLCGVPRHETARLQVKIPVSSCICQWGEEQCRP